VGNLVGSPQLGRELVGSLCVEDQSILLCIPLATSSSSRLPVSGRLGRNTLATAWLILSMARRHVEPWPTWPVAVSYVISINRTFGELLCISLEEFAIEVPLTAV